MRKLLAGFLAAVALLVVPLGDLGLWTRRELLNSDAFTSTASDVVQQPDVRGVLADRLVEEIVRQEPRLASSTSIVRPAIVTLIGTKAFQTVFSVAVREMHAQLERRDDQLTLQLNGALPLVRDTVTELDARAGALVPQSGLPVITVVQKKDAKGLWAGVRVADQLSWALPLLMLGLLAAAVALSRRRATMLIVLGVGVAVDAMIVVLLLRTGRGALSNDAGSPVSDAAFNSAWDTITGSLVTQTIVLGVLGLLAVGAGVMWHARETGNQRSTIYA